MKVTEEQHDYIENEIFHKISIIQWTDDGFYLDDFISFDEMAKLVDYLRTHNNIK